MCERATSRASKRRVGPARRLCLSAVALLIATSASASGPTSIAPPSASSSPDPRALLVEFKIERRHAEALAAVERLLRENLETAHAFGLTYLRGHLLFELDRRQEALEAFAATLTATPALEPYSRYRLAREQARLGHPELASGLLAPLLAGEPPRTLVNPAMRLLRRTLAAGGDCRLLRGLERRRFSRTDTRYLRAAGAECALREGDAGASTRIWTDLLEENRDDEVARLAAEGLTALPPSKKSARTHLLIGLAFHAHREFEIAIHHLARALVQLPGALDIRRSEVFDLRYALARSHFWLGRYADAAIAFDALAGEISGPSERAQVLYQEGRSFELEGDWTAASAAYDRAFSAEPDGDWGSAALIGRLRLAWLEGDESAALAKLGILLAKRKHSTASRALLFLAVTDLVEGRADRARGWLDDADRLGRLARPEVMYWRGRLEEIEGHPGEAVLRYLEAVQAAPYHPLARAAFGRLHGEQLRPEALRLAERMTVGERPAGLYAAWLLFGDGDPRGGSARRRLLAHLESDPASATFLRLGREPASSWPLWGSDLRRPEEMLLALGLFAEGAPVVLRHFPIARPGLAFTGSLALARSGETYRSLYIAEILRKRVPSQLPPQLLPTAYQQLLFPLSYRHLIVREANRWRIDPHLLAGIIREESRFDPEAFSAASARGLTQFVFSTARDLAKSTQLGPIEPDDLENPEVAITLGASYLHRLSEHFDGFEPQIVAAYNAGEPQAELWKRYCRSGEPEEYLSKVAFRETRDYLVKVLTSRAHYAELYADVEVVVSPAP